MGVPAMVNKYGEAAYLNLGFPNMPQAEFDVLKRGMAVSLSVTAEMITTEAHRRALIYKNVAFPVLQAVDLDGNIFRVPILMQARGFAFGFQITSQDIACIREFHTFYATATCRVCRLGLNCAHTCDYRLPTDRLKKVVEKEARPFVVTTNMW